MQAVLLPDDRRLLGDVDAPLGAVGRTPLAADAGVGDAVALGLCLARADGVALAEDGADPQVEIFDVHIPDAENDTDLPGSPRVDVGQVGLLRKDAVPPCGLLCVGHRFGCARQADHLFVHGVAQHLHLGKSQQLPAEVLAPGGEEIQGVRFIVDGADVPHLGAARFIHRGKGEHPHIAQFFQTGLRVHLGHSFGSMILVRPGRRGLGWG